MERLFELLDGTITAVDLATGSVTTIKIDDGAVTTAKIADGAVTNVKLAPNAIPFASTYSITTASTTETVAWTDMTGMSVSLTLDRTSHVLIMFRSEALNPTGGEVICIRALVDSNIAYPGTIQLTPIIWDYAFTYDNIDVMSYTYNFYRPYVSAGTYTIKIQWRVSGGTGYAYYRTLTVIALPA